MGSKFGIHVLHPVPLGTPQTFHGLLPSALAERALLFYIHAFDFPTYNQKGNGMAIRKRALWKNRLSVEQTCCSTYVSDRVIRQKSTNICRLTAK